MLSTESPFINLVFPLISLIIKLKCLSNKRRRPTEGVEWATTTQTLEIEERKAVGELCMGLLGLFWCFLTEMLNNKKS